MPLQSLELAGLCRQISEKSDLGTAAKCDEQLPKQVLGRSVSIKTISIKAVAYPHTMRTCSAHSQCLTAPGLD
jgi:hypothetical protein